MKKLLIALLVSPALAQEIPQEKNTCISVPTGFEKTSCDIVEYQPPIKQMENSYNRLIKALPPEKKQALEAEQAAWLKERTAYLNNMLETHYPKKRFELQTEAVEKNIGNGFVTDCVAMDKGSYMVYNCDWSRRRNP